MILVISIGIIYQI